MGAVLPFSMGRSRSCPKKSNRALDIVDVGTPFETWQSIVKTKMSPHCWPSGVSMAQLYPHWDKCSWRGVGILPSFLRAVMIRRMWAIAV